MTSNISWNSGRDMVYILCYYNMKFSNSKLNLANMKIIIILGFFGILSNANGEIEIPTTINECLQIPPQPNFDSTRYFNGTWYLTHAQHGSSTSVCRTLTTELLPNGTLDHTAYGYSQKGGKDIFYKIHCSGNETAGKVSLNCKIVEGARKHRSFYIEGAVIETDYDHFSIFYRCAVNQIRMGDNVLILNRKKNSAAEYPLIEKALEKAGLALEEFISRNEVDCKPHPAE